VTFLNVIMTAKVHWTCSPVVLCRRGVPVWGPTDYYPDPDPDTAFRRDSVAYCHSLW